MSRALCSNYIPSCQGFGAFLHVHSRALSKERIARSPSVYASTARTKFLQHREEG